MIRLALLVARKDLRIEGRTRVLLWQVVPFGVMALLLCGLAVGPDASTDRRLAPGLFYVVVTLVALFVIGRSAQLEGARGTRTSVITLGLDPAAVYLGKALAVFCQLCLASAVLLAGVVVFLHVPGSVALAAAPVIVLGLTTMAVAGVLYGMVATSAASANTLLPILALPAFAPVLIAGERSFSALLTHQGYARWVGLLALAVVAYTGIGILLYGALEES